MEVWVTIVTTESQVEEACLLASSLKKVKTRKKVVVQVSTGLEQSLIDKLRVVFDWLLYEEPKTGGNLEDLEAWAKLRVAHLTIFDKMVVLRPSAVVAVNIDDIFDKYGTSVGRMVEVVWGGNGVGVSSDALVVTPSRELVRILEEKVLMEGVNGVAERFRRWLMATREEVAISSLTATKLDVEVEASEPIAIVGLSFRFPGGSNPSQFWSLLHSGCEGIKKVPDHRWLPGDQTIECIDRSTEAGFLDCRVDLADHRFFGWSPSEAEFLDPQQRLLHEVSWEALEDAGVDPTSLAATHAGIFVGTWTHDYERIAMATPDQNYLRTYLGNSVAATAARLAHFFGTTGPALGFELACSSSIAALHSACTSLRLGEIPVALVGGANLLLEPFTTSVMEMVLAPDSRCKTFDASANGFVRAEGVAAFVLKRLSDAVADEDRVWGVVRGSAVVQEGTSKSLGTPTVHSEALVMELALKAAGVRPEEVSVVEAHGTGTAVGDPIEVAAIKKAYGGRRRDEPLRIGSVKTNIGHTESCSGLAGIVKVLLALREEVLPPHRNLEVLNPELDLEGIPAIIPLSPVPWERVPGKPRIAGVSSFGISGADGHVIIQEPPPQVVTASTSERPSHILKLSAKSPEALEELMEKYTEFLEGTSVDFADLCFSTNTGRATFPHRAVIIASDLESTLKILKGGTFMRGEVGPGTTSKLCFLFPGQGSQYPGMAKELYATSPAFRHHFDDCDRFLQSRYDIHLKPTLWGDATEVAALNRTLYSQTAIFCIEYCLLQLWRSWGITPDLVVGHSLGEYCAAVATASLTFEEALTLVAERSRLIDALPQGRMLVIRESLEVVEKLSKKFGVDNAGFWLDVAAVNSPEQVVLAGDAEQVEAFSAHCNSNGVKAIVLASSHAFHSRHMDAMLRKFGEVVASTLKAPPKVGGNRPGYVSGMGGKVMEDLEELRTPEYWVRHTREPVRFAEACQTIEVEGGTCVFLEVGPHPILSALTMANLSTGTFLPSLRRGGDEWTTLLESLGKVWLSSTSGGGIDWKSFDKCYPHRKRVELPTYPFQRKRAWARPVFAPRRLHPLLGRPLQTAVEGKCLFHNEITVKGAPYLSDHVIGSTVIFPGAGFLELCLAAGYAATQELYTSIRLPPRRPLHLANLTITAPLALSPTEFTTLQTVVTMGGPPEVETAEFGGYTVTVSSRTSCSDSTISGVWMAHATANFRSMLSPRLHHLSTTSNLIDVEAARGSWEQVDTSEFYAHFTKVGLHFGLQFQSLSTLWRDSTSEKARGLFQVKVPPPPPGSELMVCHPVVVDAMIQAFLLNRFTSTEGGGDNNLRKLMVPVRIADFVYFPPQEGTSTSGGDTYIYTWTEIIEGVETSHSALVSTSGATLAYMSGLELIETTSKLVEEHASSTSNTLPQLWKEVWRRADGPLENALHLADNPLKIHSTAEEGATHAHLRDVGESGRETIRTLDLHADLLVLRALQSLGWAPKAKTSNKPFSTSDVASNLAILPKHTKYLDFFLSRFAKRGWLIETSASKFTWANLPPQGEPTSPEGAQSEFLRLRQIGADLAQVLTGLTDPLAVVFPESTSKISAGDYYGAVMAAVQPPLEYSVHLLLDRCMRILVQQPGRVLRVLEVGAGTGTFSKLFLDRCSQQLEESQVVEYHFTDISPAFFAPASEYLKQTGKTRRLVFAKFDMDVDPLSQGFPPNYFDIAIAAEALHVAKDLRRATRHLRTLVKTGGTLVVLESITPNPRTFLQFGLLEGYWHFEDAHLRTLGPVLEESRWRTLLESSGFSNFICHPMRENEHGVIFAHKEESSMPPQVATKFSWLIFDHSESEMESGLARGLRKKLEKTGRKVYVSKRCRSDEVSGPGGESFVHSHLYSALSEAEEEVEYVEGVIYLWALEPNTRDQRLLTLPLVTLCQIMEQLDSTPKLVIVTKGACDVVEGSPHLTNPSGAPTISIFRTMFNELPGLNVHHFDLDPKAPALGQVDQVFHNMWSTSSEQFAFRGGSQEMVRFAPKLVTSTLKHNEDLPLPRGSDRFQLTLPQTKLISDLEFTTLDPAALGPTEIEVEVNAVALNFRDLFLVIKPTSYFEKGHLAFGFDLSGVVSKVGLNVTKYAPGDRVVGVNFCGNLAMPSHLNIDERAVVRLPPSWTTWEGATIPTVFYTAYTCLSVVGKVKKGETVLIHTASGGVGLCAVQLCQQLGAKIIATAGSERKRAFLKNLGIQHVFHSRNTDFGAETLEATKGAGVHLVLNSLTGEGFKEASLACLGKGGRFIEMSKLNVWTAEDVAKLRPDVTYSLVDLSEMKVEELAPLRDALERHLEQALLRPIPYERFDAVNVRGALEYMAKAQHIGKIVCVMPTLTPGGTGLKVATPLFNSNSTYLVTGGLSGIGFEVVKWILDNGGKHVAIISRRANAPPRVAAKIEALNKSGSKVCSFSADVGDFGQLTKVWRHLERGSDWPPLRGVFHSAGLLSDGTLPNQNWAKFETTLRPKVDGTWGLHDLSLSHSVDLEFFVVFSSIVGPLAVLGQANHSAANTFEDAFVSYRHSLGLPATAVAWGQWGEVGVATELDFPGLRPLSTSQGLAALGSILRTQTRRVGVSNIASFGEVALISPFLKGYVEDKRLFGSDRGASRSKGGLFHISTEQFWKQLGDAGDDQEKRLGVVIHLIELTLKSILRLEEDDPFDPHTEFQAMGADSLVMLEMKNHLQNGLGTKITLTPSHFKDCNTPHALGVRLLELLDKNIDKANPPPSEVAEVGTSS